MDHRPFRVLRPSRLKTITIALGSFTFAMMGLWMILAGEPSGWWIALFFGIAAIVFGVTALPNSSYLKLGPEGFTLCSMYRSHAYRWSDVGPFIVGRVGLNPMVVFNFSDQYNPSPHLRKFASGLTGFEGALPDSYGLPLSELAQLLNAYREENQEEPLI